MQQLSEKQHVSCLPLRVCYLDFDGVVHDDAVYRLLGKGIHLRTPGRTLFEWLPVLERLLAPYPDVKIVLSTSWVRVMGFDFAKRQLSPGLRLSVIGATFHNKETQKFDFDNMSRGMQICAHVERREPTSWFAIDNDVRGWPEWARGHLVKTEDRFGLSDPDVQNEIRNVLASF